MRIERHRADEAAVAAAREDFSQRIGTMVRQMSKREVTHNDWFMLADGFLDHLGALSVEEPGLDSRQAKFILDNAAMAAAGAVAYAAYFPDHSFNVFLDYVNFGMSYDARSEGDPVSPSVGGWLDAFCLTVLSGTVERHSEAFHHARTPAEEVQNRSPSDDLADGLMAYAFGDTGDVAASRPPSEEDKLAALDAALARVRAFGDERGLDVSQRGDTIALHALRALTSGDRKGFGAALTRLLLQRKEFAAISTAPRYLLPLLPLALAALAYSREGWVARR
ncbi:Imm49 family immunity protein [Streptomyces sp. NPDC005426]|uniref:Imm49 family immunity protein n=1 Tax=Streptomyces sp. NPDC005426 TaxID=3155344 RepID=UPI0033A0EBAC